MYYHRTKKIMPFIAKYFTKDDTTYAAHGIVAYVFDDSQRSDFINDCLVPFREAYIKEEKLVQIVKDYGTRRRDEINERLPKAPDVVAGDFGEILTYYLVKEVLRTDATFFPMKWRLKDKKDAASPYTDVIVFKLDPNGASPKDAMYTYEVKLRSKAPYGNYSATKGYLSGKKQCVFIDAVCDAYKDHVSRAGESILYLRTRCKDLDLKDEYEKIKRFTKPFCTVKYDKECSAVAIVDSSFKDMQIAKIPADLFKTFKKVKNVFFVPVKDLKNLYQAVFAQLPNA